MKLEEFAATKPKELRLGQYFYNTFLHKEWEGHLKLYNEKDEQECIRLIQELMNNYQWKELPE